MSMAGYRVICYLFTSTTRIENGCMSVLVFSSALGLTGSTAYVKNDARPRGNYTRYFRGAFTFKYTKNKKEMIIINSFVLFSNLLKTL